MLAVVRLLRSKKQVVELFCLLLSVPLVFINLDLHLARLSPHHSSLAAAIKTRRVRDLAEVVEQKGTVDSQVREVKLPIMEGKIKAKFKYFSI